MEERTQLLLRRCVMNASRRLDAARRGDLTLSPEEAAIASSVGNRGALVGGALAGAVLLLAARGAGLSLIHI